MRWMVGTRGGRETGRRWKRRTRPLGILAPFRNVLGETSFQMTPRQLLAGTDELRTGRDGIVSLCIPALIEPVASGGPLGRKEATTQPHDRRVLVGRSERTAIPILPSYGPEARQSVQASLAGWGHEASPVRNPGLVEAAPDESSIVGPKSKLAARSTVTTGAYPF